MIRSTACVVFNPPRVSRRNALCSASIDSARKIAPLQTRRVLSEHLRLALGHGI